MTFNFDSLVDSDANVIPAPNDSGTSKSTLSLMLNSGAAASNSLSSSEFTLSLALNDEAAASNSLHNSESTVSSMLDDMATVPNNLGNTEGLSALLPVTFPVASALTPSLQINQTPATTHYEPAIGGTISTEVPSIFGTSCQKNHIYLIRPNNA
jgi:hypothetical protein